MVATPTTHPTQSDLQGHKLCRGENADGLAAYLVCPIFLVVPVSNGNKFIQTRAIPCLMADRRMVRQFGSARVPIRVVKALLSKQSAVLVNELMFGGLPPRSLVPLTC